MKYLDIIAISFFVLLAIPATVLVVQAFRKGPGKIGPVLRDGVNRFS